MFSLADEAITERPTNIMCTMCGRVYKSETFLSGRALIFAALKDKSSLCPSCYAKLVKRTISEISKMCKDKKTVYYETTKYICQTLGLYYSKDTAKSKYKEELTIEACVSKYVKYATKIKETYWDTIRQNIKGDASNTSDISMDEVSEDTVRRFGRGFLPYQYKYLQDEYEDWTTRHECNTKAQEEIFIQICFAELDIYEGRRVGEDVTKKVQTLQSLLDAAKLQPKQNHNESISDAQTFGTLIDKWEDEKPIPECEDKYKDVDDIAKYITAFFYGHTCKTVGIKNFYSKTYDDVMREYTVNRPEYDDDDTSEAIFDKIFGNKLKDESDAEREKE